MKKGNEKMKEETNEKFLVHDTIISCACVIWAVASIALMVYFSGLNQVTFTIMTFGQLFLIMGIIFLCRKQIAGAVFTVTGIGCIILPAISEWGYLFNENLASQNNVLPALLSTGITVLGIAMLVVPGVLENSAERKCKKIVKAECVDLKEVKLSNNSVAYAPDYQYEYEGNVYTKCTEKYKKTQIPNVGSRIDIRINVKKPEEVYIKASKSSLMLIYIFGFSFFIAGLGMIITVLSV